MAQNRFFSFFLFFVSVCVLNLYVAGPVQSERSDIDSGAVFEDCIGPADIVSASNGKFLYVLEKDASQIRMLESDGKTLRKKKILPLPIKPERMRIFPDRKHLAVVGGGPLGRLLVVESNSLAVTADIPVGHGPYDLAVYDPGKEDQNNKTDKTLIYVANRFDGSVSVVELADDFRSGKTLRTIPAGREPVALAVTENGQKLIVVNHLPEDPALKFDIASKTRIIETKTDETTPIRLLPGAMGLRDVVLSPDGRYAFVSGVLGNFEHLTDSVGSGWMNENHLFVIDVERKKFAGSHVMDQYNIGSANPWGVSLSDDGNFLVVLAAGSCDLILLNRERLIRLFDGFTGRTPESARPDPIQDQMLPVKMRIPLGLKGVRHAAMTDGKIYVTSYFEDALMLVEPIFSQPYNYISGVLPQDDLTIPRSPDKKFRNNIRSDLTTATRTNFVKKENSRATPIDLSPTKDQFSDNDSMLRFQALPEFVIAPGIRFQRSFAWIENEPDWSQRRYGEMLFHDAVLCEDHWQSCSSCHPEGRADALNWDLLNDGQDNPKNTKSLLLAHETPPAMVTGIRDRAEIAVRKGFETILMIPCTDEEAEAVDTFLMSMKPVSSSKLVFDRGKPNQPGQLSEAAKRGKRVFNSDRAGCSLCHPEPLFTDMQKHNVGTSTIKEASPFDTPTLIEVWRTAPYLHDGRYATLRELIVDGKHFSGRPGETELNIDRLTDQEIDDLIEYVLSL